MKAVYIQENTNGRILVFGPIDYGLCDVPMVLGTNYFLGGGLKYFQG